jgi:malonyl-CoA O-methyltransferase
VFNVARYGLDMTSGSSTAVTADTRAAYERWAPLYPPFPHNPLMRAEQEAMLGLWPQVRGQRVLDLACGSGRYSRLLVEHRAAQVVALDDCAGMLAQVSGADRVRGTMMSLPFASGTFDAVVCGLAIGHAFAVAPWMSQVARVLKPGGLMLYSDFHPAAARAGLPRSFKDQEDRQVIVPHSRHELADQLQAAAAANLTVEEVREVRAGIELNETFSQSDDFYRRWHGLPLLLIVRARKSR